MRRCRPRCWAPRWSAAATRPAFAAAITSCASVITPIIPPGDRADHLRLPRRRVGRAAVHRRHRARAAALRGLMFTVHLMSKRRGYKPLRERTGRRRAELWRAVRRRRWRAVDLAFILLGIRYGIFTPTEAGAMTVVYAAPGRRGLAPRAEMGRGAVDRRSRRCCDTASVMIMICAASAFGFYMSWERIPSRAAAMAGRADAAAVAAAAADQPRCWSWWAC